MKTRRLLLSSLPIAALLVSGGWWAWKTQQQYRLDRQLIAALQHHDTAQARSLVKAGADPNTRFAPLPPPTLRSLLDRLLRRSPPPANTTRTALVMACGDTREPPKTIESENDMVIQVKDVPEDVPLVESMLAHGADVQAHDAQHWTALHAAVEQDHLRTVELLLRSGADPNVQDSEGEAPLHKAVSSFTPDMAHLLLTHRANPNIQDEYQRTPLEESVLEGDHPGVVRELLEHGADPDIKDNMGDSARYFARLYGYADLLRLMHRYGGKRR